MKEWSLQNKKLLEPGAGSGLISIYAAQKGALVTATDINPAAIECMKENSKANNVQIDILTSDLFSEIPPRVFDIIVINPPYYKKDPESYSDYAWNCGSNGEYFKKLFSEMKNYIHDETKILMVLCDGCDMEMIRQISNENGYCMEMVFSKKNMIEKNFIYSIKLSHDVSDNFEEKYISLRKKENRLCTDEQVKWLPEIESSHPHYKEWETRKNSCDKLIQHLSNKKTELNILEIGCGNGWLCHHLSKIPGSKIAGVDINKTELDQARRVFDHLENVEFFYGGIDNEGIRNERFDTIVFAASIQYFSSLEGIIPAALQLLQGGGEIHILDSHFYRSSEIEAARQRSSDYYQSLQSDEMSEHYFHHCIDELQGYDHKILYNPDMLRNRLMKNKNPFPWICIYG